MFLLYRIRSTLWNIVGAHLSLQHCPNGSEPADDPRVERNAIHGIKPNSVTRDEGHYTFGSAYIVSRFDQLFACGADKPDDLRKCHFVPYCGADVRRVWIGG